MYHTNDDVVKTLTDLRDELHEEAEGVKERMAQGICMKNQHGSYDYWVGMYTVHNYVVSLLDNKISKLTVKFQDDEDAEEGWSNLDENKERK